MTVPLPREFMVCLSEYIKAHKSKGKVGFSLRASPQTYVLSKKQLFKLNLCFRACFVQTLRSCSSHEPKYVTFSHLQNDLFRSSTQYKRQCNFNKKIKYAFNCCWVKWLLVKREGGLLFLSDHLGGGCIFIYGDFSGDFYFAYMYDI